MSVQPATVVVVQGLTSERGKALNGCNGRMILREDAALAPSTRIPVLLDGELEPIAIKRSNLKVIDPNKFEHFEVNILRPHFRTNKLSVVMRDRDAQVIYRWRHVFEEADFGRARVNLLIVSTILLQELDTGTANRNIMVFPTDLNVARALQKALSTSSKINLGPSLDAIFQNAVRIIRVLQKNKKANLLISFFPARISPAVFEEREGEKRLQATENGCYKIYPCPHQDFFDALEVRFACRDKGRILIQRETFQDYGEQEVIEYVSNAVALGESTRLSPKCLAKRNPQTFWSVVLHLDTFLQTCQKNCPNYKILLKQWRPFVDGSQRCQMFWKQSICRGRRRIHLSEATQGVNWGIGNSEVKHKRLSMEYAMYALYAVYIGLAEHHDSEKEIVPVWDHYQDTEIGRFVLAFICAKAFHAPKWNPKLRYELWSTSFEKKGFNIFEMFAKSDPKASCGRCGCKDSSKLKECAGCGGAVYCSKDCQTVKWKEHKKVCSPVITETRRLFQEMKLDVEAFEFAASSKAGLSIARSLESYAGMTALSEVSSLGSVAFLLKIAGGKSILTFNGYAPSSADLGCLRTGKSPNSDFMMIFEKLNDLPILERFLVSCGPLRDIQIAKKSLDEALWYVGGNLENLRIRACGFTALEWAAKKGNKDIVEWLCNDSRTQGLIGIGSPVGWACYTGQVEIAKVLVDRGANPAANHPSLWGEHPLLCAAQNGQFEAVKWLVEDMGQNIRMVDQHGGGILSHIMTVPDWPQLEGHMKCFAWAEKMLES